MTSDTPTDTPTPSLNHCVLRESKGRIFQTDTPTDTPKRYFIELR